MKHSTRMVLIPETEYLQLKASMTKAKSKTSFKNHIKLKHQMEYHNTSHLISSQKLKQLQRHYYKTVFHGIVTLRLQLAMEIQ